MFFGTIVKDEHANSMVESHIEEGTLIPVYPKPIAILITTTEDLVVDVRVQETETTIMEK